jgi:GNAT superfamily N-acetyltransferase
MLPEKQTLLTGYILCKSHSKNNFDLNKLIFLNSEVTSFLAKLIIILTLFMFLLNLFLVLIVYHEKIIIDLSFFISSLLIFVNLLMLTTLASVLGVFGLCIIFPISKKKYVTWIIEKNKSLVGFIQLSDSNSKIDIIQVFILPNCRRRGLGSALIKHLVENTNKPVYVDCLPALVSYYARLGFIQTGTPPCSNQTYSNQIITMVYPRK